MPNRKTTTQKQRLKSNKKAWRKIQGKNITNKKQQQKRTSRKEKSRNYNRKSNIS